MLVVRTTLVSGEQVVAEGEFGTPGPFDKKQYAGQFNSALYSDCGIEVGHFVNNYRCRKWTDTDGRKGNTPNCFVDIEPEQPPKRGIVNVGDVTLEIGRKRIVCPSFGLEGIQTYGTETYNGEALAVFLFTGSGTSDDGARVTGVGRTLQRLIKTKPPDPAKAPPPVAWRFVLTICRSEDSEEDD